MHKFFERLKSFVRARRGNNNNEATASDGGGSTNGVRGNAGNEARDGLIWSRESGKYGYGEFSMAVVQANVILEDQCQLEAGPFGTFVGIYDGHGGYDASRFVCDNIFRHFQALASQSNGVVTPATIEAAFRLTEHEFAAFVARSWHNDRPAMATVGTCCLVGVIFEQTIFVANLGDSRAVLGTRVRGTGNYGAVQLSTEHNVSNDDVRREIEHLHPSDPQVVQMKRGAWRVKGIIQVCRSIGDMFLKDSDFNKSPIATRFRIPEPMDMPYLTANPDIVTRPISPDDVFLIFASDGLWEFLSNEQAVEIVRTNSRSGIAKKLIKAALTEAASRRGGRLLDLYKLQGVRRQVHDDISVIVLFFNHSLISRATTVDPPLSVRGPFNY
ncbi:probable protein phosphatase 2C 42 [Prosopis cineraria]|uniref:probable protein phosphatase 2C 42 n=1 Tax=Prosopis cineraria TaxID=364024 RepID=UPI0024109A62|nr:probable protein phosphatase 2C 42 [Prosopis cineraria]